MTKETISIRIAQPEDETVLSALIVASYATLEDDRYDRSQLAKAQELMSKANPKLLASGKAGVPRFGSP